MDDVKGGSKRAKARITRQRIVRAAHDEFVDRGFHSSTITSIATRAGVAAQTIYFVFHTKAELMSAVIDEAVMGDDEEIPQETEWWNSMSTAPHASEALRIFIRGAAPSLQRASAISEILRAAAQDDDEVRRTYEAHEELRRIAFQQVIEMLARKNSLRAGLSVVSATDILMTIFGDATYQALISHGWDHEQLVDWLCLTLPELLLAEPCD